MGTLYLVRHGQASFGADDYDVLSALGHQQSVRLGEYFKYKGVSFDAALTGTLTRQIQTFVDIYKGMGLEFESEAAGVGASERSAGPPQASSAPEGLEPAAPSLLAQVWTGDRGEASREPRPARPRAVREATSVGAHLLWPGLNEYDSEAVIGAIHPHPLEKPATPELYRHHFRLLKAGLAQWMAGAVSPQGMPSYTEFVAGVTSALDHIRTHYDGNVLLVSSGGPIATAVGHVLGTRPEATIELNLRIRNSSVTEFAFNPKRHNLVSYNTLPHLDAPEHASWITYALANHGFPVLSNPQPARIICATMTIAHTSSLSAGGIRLRTGSAETLAAASQSFLAQLAQLGLQHNIQTTDEVSSPEGGVEKNFHLRADLAQKWAAGLDTTNLTALLQLDTEHRADDLEREILLALLLSPQAFEFPSHAELAAAVRIRRNLVVAARKTALAFHTTEVDRPEDCWIYTRERGFTVRTGHALIPALQKATQPEASGKLYSFSCYRATEYVILLAIAQELAQCNPALLERLQQQWERRAITSGQFHEVFLREYGSMEVPLPPKYYVPGDRLWFRNPDAHSSDVSGYEGSWVFYLGGGLFTNLWKREQPYTLTSKCLELFHWRHATYLDEEGELRIDESIVEARVKASLADPAQTAQILELMLRLREPQGVYQSGGCIDTSREYPRWVCPGSADLILPPA